MRVLVTGASGFIGGHLVALLLERGHAVRALVRPSSDRSALPDSPGLEFALGQLDPDGEQEGLARALEGVDAVIHCGATTRKVQASERALIDINQRGTAGLAELCLRATRPPRLVLASTISAVGPSLRGELLDEQSRPHPQSGYGRSKLAGEEELRARRGKLPFSIVRLPAVWGPRDTNLVPLLRMVQRGLRPSGAAVSNFIHVRDASRALLLAAEQPAALDETFHATGDNLSRSQLGHALAEGLGARTIPFPLPRWLLLGAAWSTERLARARGLPARLDMEKARELAAHWPLDGRKAERLLAYRPERHLDSSSITALLDGYRALHWI